jgi:hypothetical protein
LQESADRKVRALLRDHPYLGLGAAFGAGFILGGGWRTRLGRFVVLAAGRYALARVAERTFLT